MIKVGFVNLGCPKNQVDSELMQSMAVESGMKLSLSDPDVIVVNTCGFIESAKSEAIENILEAVELKKQGKIRGIVVAGCLSERYKSEIRKELPEVDAFLGTGSYEDIVKAITFAYNNNEFNAFARPEDHIIEGKRILTTPPYTAYLRISEGCDNHCTYCAIPSIRGRFRSRSPENVLSEAESLARSGVKELIVVSQDTCRYGTDLEGGPTLAQLLKNLCKISGIEWVRVMYLYPDRITDELIDVIANEEKIVKYIEMPVQHASESVLRRMNRRGDKDSLLKMVKKLRKSIKGAVLRTTLITGFPGETDEDFECLMEFVNKAKFERLGVFPFSREEGTPAYKLPDQIDDEIKNSRLEAIMSRQMDISQNFLKRQKGKTLRVLTEGYDDYIQSYYGRSFMDAPDIDGKVFFKSNQRVTEGEFVLVTITGSSEYDLFGDEAKRDERDERSEL